MNSCFPQYCFCLSILLLGQGQKSKTNGRAQARQTKSPEDEYKCRLQKSNWNGIHVQSDWKQTTEAIARNSTTNTFNTTRAMNDWKQAQCTRHKTTRQGHCNHGLGPFPYLHHIKSHHSKTTPACDKEHQGLEVVMLRRGRLSIQKCVYLDEDSLPEDLDRCIRVLAWQRIFFQSCLIYWA